jgi:hypothetical protein
VQHDVVQIRTLGTVAATGYTDGVTGRCASIGEPPYALSLRAAGSGVGTADFPQIQ